MPTRQELNEAIAEQRVEIETAAARARRMRRMGLIDARGENKMLAEIGRPKACDPAEFPHAGRLK